MAGAVAFVGEGISAEAAADLSALQYYVMKISAANKVNKATAAGDILLGILQNKPISGKTASVKVMGGSKAVAGAAITAGTRLTADSSGRVITTTTDTNSVIGIALEAALAANDVISILIINSMVAG